jgi:PAS domain S-box-containing protein
VTDWGLLPALFADSAWWAGITATSTIVGGAVSGAVVWVWARWKERRGDAIKEWIDLCHSTQERAERLEAKAMADEKAWNAKFDAERARLEKEVAEERASRLKETNELRAAWLKEVADVRTEASANYQKFRDCVHQCEVDKVRQQARIEALITAVRALQKRAGLSPPPSVIPGMIVTDGRGTVRVASPALTAIYHWFAADLVGRGVDRLFGEDMLKRFREESQTACEAEGPCADAVLTGNVLTKEGEAILSSVAMHAWRTDGGETMISAEIRPLDEGGES